MNWSLTHPLVTATLLLCALASCKRSETGAEFHARTERLNETCRQSVGTDFVYRTAAGFQLAVPKYASGSLHASQYGADCRLKDIRLVFAWVDGKLIPVPQGGLYHPADLKLPERYESLVVMMSFKPPETMVGPEHWEYCKGKQPRFDYPGDKLLMCPQSDSPHPPRLATLPYRPRFEIVGAKVPPYSFSCGDADFDKVTTENVTEAEIRYSCRGYWYWRPGAAGMFDIGGGKVLRQAHRMLPAAERLMDAWIVKEGNRQPD